MARWTLITTSLAFLFVVAGGCPSTPTDSTSPDTMTLRTTAPQEAEKGETVPLKVELPDDVDLTALVIRWFQTFGRTVTITDADQVEASFEAPSLEAGQVLTFRVDVETAAGKIFSKSVSITINADPDYVAPDDHGTDDDSDLYPVVTLDTTMGTIKIELDRKNAKLTTNNFLRYVKDGFYDGTIFHRVIAEFVIQGGGYDEDLVKKTTRPSILGQSNNGLSNVRGTISMAHLSGDPDSGTSQFFINLVDNLNLDYDNPDTDEPADGDKHTVFGKVIEGMDVVDAISEVETESKNSLSDVPVDNVVINKITISSSSSSDKTSSESTTISGSD